MQERRPLDGVPVLLISHNVGRHRLLGPLLALIEYLWKTKGDKGTILWERSFRANYTSTTYPRYQRAERWN